MNFYNFFKYCKIFEGHNDEFHVLTFNWQAINDAGEAYFERGKNTLILRRHMRVLKTFISCVNDGFLLNYFTIKIVKVCSSNI